MVVPAATRLEPGTLPAGSQQPSPSLLFPDGTADQPVEPGQGHAAARDLNLDQIIVAVAGDREQRDLITGVLSSPLRDTKAVRYRQEVFDDLADPAINEAARRFAGEMTVVRAHLSQLAGMRYTLQREGWLLDAAAIYCGAVQSFATSLTGAPVESRALDAFRGYLTTYTASPAFTVLAEQTRQRKESLGQIRYTTRIRAGRVEVARYEGEADYSEQVLATFDRFKQGAVKDYRVRYRTWPGMNHIAAQILDLVARLFPGEFTALADYCRRHAGFLDDGIGRASRELGFYLAYLDYIQPIRDAGLRFCRPEVSTTSKAISAEDTFDLALAAKRVKAREPVVTNDFRLDGAERVFVVTGPNQGGKTTFARTFGQLHHLAATGCPVPGSAARLFLPDRIFTHFEREEDPAQLSGKLEDDLRRAGDIVCAATSDSVVILNEVFTSTTTDDARFLGTKLLTKIMRLDALCVCVTFVDELAALGEQVVSMMSTVDPANPAERTYRVIRKPADGLAHALAIAEKYDLTYHQLQARLTP